MIRVRASAALLAAFIVCAHAVGATTIARRIGPCTLIAAPEASRALDALSPVIPRALAQLRDDLGAAPRAPYTIALLAPGRPTDPVLARLDARAPAWAAGYMVPAERIGAVRLGAASQQPWSSPASALAHETTHLVLHDADDDRLPRWFEEGVAMWEEHHWSLTDALGWSMVLARGEPPTLAEIENAFPAAEGGAERAYAVSAAFVAWNVRRHGDGFLRAVVDGARDASFDAAWKRASGAPLAVSELAWRRAAVRHRWWLAAIATGPLWLFASALVVAGALRRRAQARAQRRRWLAEERARTPLVPPGP